jgi:hypothetical protein
MRFITKLSFLFWRVAWFATAPQFRQTRVIRLFIPRAKPGRLAFFANNGEWLHSGSYATQVAFPLTSISLIRPTYPACPPRPFLCPNTVKGFAIWKNGPPPIDFGRSTELARPRGSGGSQSFPKSRLSPTTADHQ